MNKKINMISKIVLGISLVILLLFSIYLVKLNILPSKYLIVGLIFIILIYVLNIILTFKTKNMISKIISIIISLLIAGLCTFVYPYLKSTYSFIENTQTEYEELKYNVIVLKDTYKSVKELENKKIGYVVDDYKDEVKKHINVNYEEIISENYNDLAESLLNKEIEALILEDTIYKLIIDENEEFKENTIVLTSYLLKVNSYIENVSSISVDKPFVLYVSGIDQYGSVKSVRGRSDVNQLIVVNPKTSKILLVNTPRDYYVQLFGTTGVKDKLTHAGVYGIERSIKTLENFYNIDIDHYLRINFDTLIKIVDVIDGVDVYSDKEFTSSHIKSWRVPKGWVHMNGKEALAFSRERYAYATGDRHRGENQQQVISAIIKKTTSTKTIVNKYTSILNALDGTFQTDMSTDNILSIIKFQLDKMPTWDVEMISVTGSDSKNYTYSMGMKRKLYVMEPDIKSVNNAKEKIKKTLKG